MCAYIITVWIYIIYIMWGVGIRDPDSYIYICVSLNSNIDTYVRPSSDHAPTWKTLQIRDNLLASVIPAVFMPMFIAFLSPNTTRTYYTHTKTNNIRIGVCTNIFIHTYYLIHMNVFYALLDPMYEHITYNQFVFCIILYKYNRHARWQPSSHLGQTHTASWNDSVLSTLMLNLKQPLVPVMYGENPAQLTINTPTTRKIKKASAKREDLPKKYYHILPKSYCST